ncbi:DUF485 domain-containing protein [Streptomyces sp. NBC_00102]|uniref:DUF485 domain-containing protein n=1 Tax=Streptomyces sp. NBC_00102 TaxID=2975652 RepID=UPI0022550402|nr:DUF485 domain-containing protein [Streptomyces sp. NBC_00102]MCX5399134.1 DUF485 domain-containing protein [Streptomyces sp. NBC_00102]
MSHAYHEPHEPLELPPPPPPFQRDYLLPWQSSPPPEPAAPRFPAAGTRAQTPGRHRDLRRLRTSYRVLRRVSTLAALGYFTAFLALSTYAPGLMGRDVGVGGLNLGLLLALTQLPIALLSLVLYERTARRTVDPLAAELRRRSRPTDTAVRPSSRGTGR